jgi:hypothetical protein
MGHEMLPTIFTEETKKIGNDIIFSLVRTNQVFEKFKPAYYDFLFCKECNRPYFKMDCIWYFNKSEDTQKDDASESSGDKLSPTGDTQTDKITITTEKGEPWGATKIDAIAPSGKNSAHVTIGNDQDGWIDFDKQLPEWNAKILILHKPGIYIHKGAGYCTDLNDGARNYKNNNYKWKPADHIADASKMVERTLKEISSICETTHNNLKKQYPELLGKDDCKLTITATGTFNDCEHEYKEFPGKCINCDTEFPHIPIDKLTINTPKVIKEPEIGCQSECDFIAKYKYEGNSIGCYCTTHQSFDCINFCRTNQPECEHDEVLDRIYYKVTEQYLTQCLKCNIRILHQTPRCNCGRLLCIKLLDDKGHITKWECIHCTNQPKQDEDCTNCTKECNFGHVHEGKPYCTTHNSLTCYPYHNHTCIDKVIEAINNFIDDTEDNNYICRDDFKHLVIRLKELKDKG